MVVTAPIPLPLFHNPNAQGKRQPVDDKEFVRTADEIAELFGGGILWVFRNRQARGFWWDRGVIDRDDVAMLEVDMEDTPANRAKLKAYTRDVLKKRFRQKAIYMKWVGPVETWVLSDQDEIT